MYKITTRTKRVVHENLATLQGAIMALKKLVQPLAKHIGKISETISSKEI